MKMLQFQSNLDESPKTPHIEEELSPQTAQFAPGGWLANLFTHYGIEAQSSSTYLSQSAYYKSGRWDIPDDEGELDNCWDDEDHDLDVLQVLNGRIQQRFMDILDDIIHYFGFAASRRALATEPTADERDDILLEYDDGFTPEYSTRPDLVILGHDSKQLPRALDSYTATMSTDEEHRSELYRGCVAVGKVERAQRRGESDRKLEKVANCAR